jgi:mannose-6-phosphate isomerase-like protein (cupin superfamily)
MKVYIEDIGGNMIKKDETYTIYDNGFLNNLTLSQTILNPGKSTKGHFHNSQEEIYIFTSGHGMMQIDETKYEAEPGDTFLIKVGQFHRVFNLSETDHCFFTCVFEKYDRSSDEAIYKNQ